MMAIPGGLSSLASKFRGCMIGGLIGDCIGAPFENDFPTTSKTVLKNYLTNLLSDSHKAGTVQIFPYTDDTAMTMSVAKSLVEKGTFDPKDMAKKFVDEYFLQPRRGYGRVVDIFKALKITDFQDVFEPAKCQFLGTGSYGNGASMRIAPVALYGYKDEDLVKQVAETSSLLTHTHQNGYNGAILQSLAVLQALKADASGDFSPVQFVNVLLEKMEVIEKEIVNAGSLEDKRPFCTSLIKIKNIFEKEHLDMSPDEIAAMLGNSMAAHKSVPTAIFSFLRGFQPLKNFETSNPFVRTLYFAIAVGGDTDTIGCMAGSIAGAYHGESIIPLSLQRRCEAIEELKNLSDQLFQMTQK